MLNLGLICNTTAAFPLLQWAAANKLLAGVAALHNTSEFFEQLESVSESLNVPLRRLERSNVSDQLIDWQKSISANLVLVLGFPLRIRPRALESASFGYYNIHFGRLPDYAGAFPVFWQIVNGEPQGTLTIHRMDPNFDTGPIAVEMPFEIQEGQSLGLVDVQYGFVAIPAVTQLLTSISNRTLELVPQHNAGSAGTGKPTAKDLVIHWEKMNAKRVTALVLAANPWNRGAHALIKGLDVKIVDALPGEATELCPGTIFRTQSGEMAVACYDNTSVVILILYCSFGYFTKDRIWTFGLSAGDRFERIQL